MTLPHHKTYTLFVEENAHHGENSAYQVGSFSSYQEALNRAKQIVDDFLNTETPSNLKAEELFKKYTLFGEDPFIIPNDENFSAWDYARQRCQVLCK